MTDVLPLLADFQVGDQGWVWPAIGIGVVGVGVCIWISRNQFAQLSLSMLFRIFGWLLLATCLINPLWSSSKPRSGANVFAVVADTSRSHQVFANAEETRAALLKQILERGEQEQPDNGWLNRIGQDFELQRYVFSEHLRRVESLSGEEFEQPASNLCTALTQMQQRFDGQPLAGVILLSDGNATDHLESMDELRNLAPVYPVILKDESDRADVAVGTVSVNQTAFDDAPVTIQAQLEQRNADGKEVRVTLLDGNGTPVQSKTQAADDESAVRFEARPEAAGTVFYTVKTELLDENGESVDEEATSVNNRRLVAVDRGSKKRRILYVSGRPNWEFKFLRRAVETDPQTEIVGLIRIAKREAKFDFRGKSGDDTSSFFKGFDEVERELAEDYDEPVLVRVGTQNDDELLGGFPEEAEDLFEYDALIIDDVEARFFLADQLQLIYEFVSRRGGGLLMMGGQESFRQGEYDRTPVGELLPVNLHRDVAAPAGPVKLELTRHGWLQPWVRLRDDEEEERTRIAQMPAFVTLNPTESIRPGAVKMAEVVDSSGQKYPALVTQRFGRGRSGALLIGDLWRWRMNEGRRKLAEFALSALDPNRAPVDPGDKPSEDLNDQARACRQMIRWLTADVPRRLDVSVEPEPELGLGTVRIAAELRGKDFLPREDAVVTFKVTRPDGTDVEVTAEPSEEMPGTFESVMAALEPGPWSVEVTAKVTEPDKPVEALTASTGWASQPDQEEMASVSVNRALLEQIAQTTGGRILSPEEIDEFVDELPNSTAPVVDITLSPLWHQWWVFLLATACFVADWTIRRRAGMP